MAPLRAFTWGYAGWGTETRHFIHAADRCERRRGYGPAVFVDLRISRRVRAANFIDHRFEKLVGADRHVWMPELGNQRILSKRGDAIQIAKPAAAEDLLDRIIRLHGMKRRVIMFCSCAQPLLERGDGFPSCHRVSVATLLLAAANRRGMPLTMAEWPGSAPVSLQREADALQARALKQGARYIPVGSVDAGPPCEAMLGWGSTVEFSLADGNRTLLTGPACVRQRQWRLEVIDGTPQDLLDGGYGPRSTGTATPEW